MSESVPDVQVLVFRLADERYCIDIAHVDEIVDREELTQLPNAKPHVEGVMDLRGTTATIVNPKTVLDLDDSASGDRVVVLDTEDEGNTGWLIDEVSRVVSVDETGLDESVEGESVRGVVRRDDDFVIWIEPSAVHA